MEKFDGGISWCMMNTKDFISKIYFKRENENNKTLSFSGQINTFRLTN